MFLGADIEDCWKSLTSHMNEHGYMNRLKGVWESDAESFWDTC